MIHTTINKGALRFVVPYLGSLLAMAEAWYTTVWATDLGFMFMASGIALLALGLSLMVVKQKWIGMGFLAGCLSFVFLMPFLPPY